MVESSSRLVEVRNLLTQALAIVDELDEAALGAEIDGVLHAVVARIGMDGRKRA